MTPIQQGEIEVIGTLLLVVAYVGVALKVRGDCDQKELGWTAVNGLAAITGVFIFLDCFSVMQTSVVNGVWSGIAGMMITFATGLEIYKKFQCLVHEKKEAIPTKSSTEEVPPPSSTSTSSSR